MDKPFVYGATVSGDNFTDRVKETKHISMNFNAGMNTILIAQRRQGKTSLINKVKDYVNSSEIYVISLDIYDCRSEYDFYERFASSIIKATAGKIEQVSRVVADFLGRVTPKISISPDLYSDFSLSLGISPKSINPEDVLNLPERIADKKGIHIVICIDEFQQIGEFPDSLTVQKKMRSAWQLHKNVSYCLYGSKKHLMEKLFQNKSMPFFQFGDMIFLERISTVDWVNYICSRFKAFDKSISKEYARYICEKVENYSSYVQQYAWNVMVEAGDVVSEEDLIEGYNALIKQTSALFLAQISNLSSYQMNFLRAISAGIHSGFSSQGILEDYRLGTKSNIARLQISLVDKELVEKIGKECFFADPVLKVWFQKEYCRYC